MEKSGRLTMLIKKRYHSPIASCFLISDFLTVAIRWQFLKKWTEQT